MEIKARKDEQLMRAMGKNDDVEKTIAVNDLYIDAISAKLKLLDQI
jgi:hypothetical protein